MDVKILHTEKKIDKITVGEMGLLRTTALLEEKLIWPLPELGGACPETISVWLYRSLTVLQASAVRDRMWSR